MALPTEFTVTRQVSLQPIFTIETKGRILGTFQRKFLTVTPEFDLLVDDKLVAIITMRFFSLGRIFDITDSLGQSLGRVKNAFSLFSGKFDLYSPNEQKIGEARLNFWQNEFKLIDIKDGRLLATFSRPFFQFKTRWTFRIHDPVVLSECKIGLPMLLTLFAFVLQRPRTRHNNRTCSD